ncbi:MAG: hypothetical protein KME10_22080 [Plectolyngbya sp. WJT66-NPBG17]|jgi:hypothetical protein|nr:hypothetical protein [Plectolyngbya sp. WJT66-NPBG17]
MFWGTSSALSNEHKTSHGKPKSLSLIRHLEQFPCPASCANFTGVANQATWDRQRAIHEIDADMSTVTIRELVDYLA